MNASHGMLCVFTAMWIHPGGRKNGRGLNSQLLLWLVPVLLFLFFLPRHPHPSLAPVPSGRVCEACVHVVGLTALSGLRPFLISSLHQGILSWQAANTHTYKYQFTSGGRGIGGRGHLGSSLHRAARTVHVSWKRHVQEIKTATCLFI